VLAGGKKSNKILVHSLISHERRGGIDCFSALSRRWGRLRVLLSAHGLAVWNTRQRSEIATSGAGVDLLL